jgi:hypothetical protein
MNPILWRRFFFHCDCNGDAVENARELRAALRSE